MTVSRLWVISYLIVNFLVHFPLYGYAYKSHSAASAGPIVNLGYAKYQGSTNTTTSVTSFRGVRYAAPPTGETSLYINIMRWGSPWFVNRFLQIPSSHTSSVHHRHPGRNCWATTVLSSPWRCCVQWLPVIKHIEIQTAVWEQPADIRRLLIPRVRIVATPIVPIHWIIC